MSKETEAAILDWENEDRNTDDDLHCHFESTGLIYWCDVAWETRRVWNLMLREDVEADSVMDHIFHAACAQASNGVFAAMSAALGVDQRALMLVIAPWYETLNTKNSPPEPITAEQLIARCHEQREELDERIRQSEERTKKVEP